MDILFRITLRRPDPSVAWGFKLQGVMDSKGTFTFQKIFPNSIADNCGLKEGDMLIAIGERLTQNLNCSEVFEIIANSGNALEIIVERPEQNKADIRLERSPLFSASKHGDPFKSQTTGVLDKEKAFSDDFARIWSIHQGKHLSTPPSLHWKSIDPNSSISPQRHHNISHFDNFSSSLNPDLSMPLRIRNAFERNHEDVSGEFKTSSYGEPSLLSDWVQSLGDDFDDKFRKVRFAEPPESNVIDLDSTSSCAPSIDWNFRETFDPFTAKFSASNFNANQNTDETANNTVDSLADEIDKIDLQKYFAEKPFGGKSIPIPSSQWQTSHYLSSPFGCDTFPKSSKSGTSSRITIPIKYELREDSKRTDNLPTESNVFDSNILQFSASNPQANVPRVSDTGNFSRTSQFSHFISDEKLQSPTNNTNSTFMTSEQNSRQLPKRNNLDNLDLKKAGLFAVLDRSITDKLMNWNRPPDLEHSATYKLLKELEKSNDDSYYG